jgi:hypothetical protein
MPGLRNPLGQAIDHVTEAVQKAKDNVHGVAAITKAHAHDAKYSDLTIQVSQ